MLKMGGRILIKVENVTKKYGSHIALDDMSFEVKEGEIVRLFRTKWSWKNYNNEHNNRIYRTNPR